MVIIGKEYYERKSTMKILIKLPDEFICPICKSLLYFGVYDNKGLMIACNNWHSNCYSPWRRMPNDMPWHVWINVYPPEFNDKENCKRVKQLIALLLKLKIDYPSVYNFIDKKVDEINKEYASLDDCLLHMVAI
jgi:hypothetical protein